MSKQFKETNVSPTGARSSLVFDSDDAIVTLHVETSRPLDKHTGNTSLKHFKGLINELGLTGKISYVHESHQSVEFSNEDEKPTKAKKTKKVKEPRRAKLLEEIIEDVAKTYGVEMKIDEEELRELVYNYAKDEDLRRKIKGPESPDEVCGELMSYTFHSLVNYLSDNKEVLDALEKSAEDYKDKRILKGLFLGTKKWDGDKQHTAKTHWNIARDLLPGYLNHLELSDSPLSEIDYAIQFLNNMDQDDIIKSESKSVEQLDEEHDEVHINPDSPWAEAMMKAKEMGIGQFNKEVETENQE